MTNRHWYRRDWFTDSKNLEDFKAQFGYNFGVQLSYVAHEVIAELFTGATSCIWTCRTTSLAR